MISLEKKADLIRQYSGSKNDVGSPQVQVAILTARILEINQHLKVAKKDRMAQRGLLQMVGRRRRLLAYLARRDYNAYKDLIQKLKLRK